MGLSSLSSARTSTAFALTRMEIQSKEPPCLLGLVNLNVAFQVSLKLVYVHLIPVWAVLWNDWQLTSHVDANSYTRFNDLLIFIHLRIGQHPLSTCQKKHKEALQLPATPLRLIPSCKRDGRFEEIQCLPVTSECWCVDEYGKEIKGTRTTGYLRCPSSGL